ncbi:MAG: lysylphosphatidylglycerol synthase domain-containing protein [Vicingaceae bacterium]
MRLIIGTIAVLFIFFRVKNDFLIAVNNLDLNHVDLFSLGLALVLMFVNWAIEAVKWKYSISDAEKVTVLKSFKLTLTGITLGFLTPNRIGEIPARALLLNKNNFKEITVKTAVASFSQLLITLLVGIIGLCLTFQNFNQFSNLLYLLPLLIIILFLLLLVYFKPNKLESVLNKFSFINKKQLFKGLSTFSMLELFNILLLSLVRYIVFTLQYYIVLKAFGVDLNTLNTIFLIPVCFMFASFIPTLLISEIGVRGSVALFVFGMVSDMDIQIVLASVILWLINVALPALLGLFNLKELKLIKED